MNALFHWKNKALSSGDVRAGALTANPKRRNVVERVGLPRLGDRAYLSCDEGVLAKNQEDCGLANNQQC